MRYIHILLSLIVVTLGHWYWIIFTDEVAILGLILLTILLTVVTAVLGFMWTEVSCLGDKVIKDT